MLEALLRAFASPPDPHVGEAYFLQQTLGSFYLLKARATLYEAHAQSPELKEWWRRAREDAFVPYITRLEELMDRFGIPKPPGIPESTQLTDHLIALEGLAWAKGMVASHAMAITATRRGDVAQIFNEMFVGAQVAGAQLIPVLERQGWNPLPEKYSGKVNP